jgi:hypothetical protein
MSLEATETDLSSAVTPKPPGRIVGPFVLAKRTHAKAKQAPQPVVASFDGTFLEDEGRANAARGIGVAVLIAVPCWTFAAVGLYLLL